MQKNVKDFESRCRFFGMLMLCASVTNFAQAQQIPEQKQIEQSARAFVTAFDAANAAAVAALWTPDGEYSLGSQTIKGRAAIKQQYEQYFKANPGTKMQVTIQSVRKLAPNVVVEEGIGSVSGKSGSQSATAYSAVHVKVDGKWMMADVRESAAPLPPKPQDLEELSWLVGDWVARGAPAHVDVKFEWVGNKQFLRAETTIHPSGDSTKSLAGGMQIIGRDPLTGQLVSWFFNSDGGHAYGVWSNRDNRWVCHTQGTTAEGAVTLATNVFYHPHENVLSWRSVNRSVGNEPLPNTEEIVLERAKPTTPAAK